MTSSPARARPSFAAARRPSPASCSSAPTAARSRSAAAACSRARVARGARPPHRRLARRRCRDRLESGRGLEPAAGRDRERFEALLAERRPLYEALADAVLPADRELVRRALPDPARASRPAGRDAPGMGAKRLGRLPGPGRPRPAGERLLAARGPALSDHRHRGRRPARRRGRAARRPGRGRGRGRGRRRSPRRSACCASSPGPG